MDQCPHCEHSLAPEETRCPACQQVLRDRQLANLRHRDLKIRGNAARHFECGAGDQESIRALAAVLNDSVEDIRHWAGVHLFIAGPKAKCVIPELSRRWTIPTCISGARQRPRFQTSARRRETPWKNSIDCDTPTTAYSALGSLRRSPEFGNALTIWARRQGAQMSTSTALQLNPAAQDCRFIRFERQGLHSGRILLNLVLSREYWARASALVFTHIFSSRPCHLVWQERQFDRLEMTSHHHAPPASLSGRSGSFGLWRETHSPAAPSRQGSR